jgi:hypothetical protein
MKFTITTLLLLITTISFAQIPSYVPSNGLVGWWPFNGNANDESGNGNNGTVNGATLTVDRFGVADKAYSFDGVNDYIQSPVISQLNSSHNTLAVWINASAYSVHHQIEYASSVFGTTGRAFAFNTSRLAIVPSTDCVSANSPGLSYLNGQLLANNWCQLVFISEAGVGKFYLNGTYLGQVSMGSSICQNPLVLILGRGTNGGGPTWYNGKLDDIGIWNRALTQSEITNLYNSVNTPAPTVSITPTSSTICGGQSTTLTASTSGSTACASSGLPTNLQTGLVGYWPFCGNANDASGNGNNGTVNGATLTTDRFGTTGSAYSFDGVNDYIVSSNNNIPNSGDFSVSFWSNLTSNINWSDGEFICLGSTSSTTWGILATNNGGGRLSRGRGCSGNGTNIINNLYNLNIWNHYVFNSVSGVTSIYKNGTFLGQTTNGTFSNCSSAQLFFGVDIFSAPEYFNGKLDDIAIWNRALTATEIQQLYTTSNSTYSWSPGGATTPSITVSPTTTTTYTCTATANGQSTTASSVVTVNPLPTVNAGVDFTKTCLNNPNGSTIGMAPAVGVTYSWAPTNGLSSANSSNPVANPSSSTTYTLTATNSVSGCSNTDQVLVVVNSTAPVANAGLDVNVNCTGSNGASIGSTAIAGIVYSWSPSIGLSSSTVSNPIANPSSTTAYTLTATNTSNGCTANDAVLVTVGSGVPISAVSLTVNDQPCGSPSVAGSMNVTLTGGVAPITYTWTRNGLNFNALPANAPTNLIAGSYTVTVTDGCGTTMTSNSVTLNNAVAIDLQAASAGANALCFGGNGTISASIFGGTSQRSLVVTNTVTNQVYTQVVPNGPPVAGVHQFSTSVPAGSYSVTAVDPGSTCPSETWLSNITITQPVNALTATTVKTDVCFGASNGTITVTAIGGTPSYTYSKDGGITFQSSNIFAGLTAGTYSIIVKDANNCSTTPSSVTITQSASALSVLVSNVTNVFCNGSNNGSINITTSGGTTPYSYAWTGPNSFTATTEDLTGRPAGTYNVVVTDAAGCTQTATATITQPSAITLANVVTNVSCTGGTNGAINLTVTGGTTPYTYAWTGPSSFTASTEDISGRPAGTYTVIVTDANSCQATATLIINTAATNPTINAGNDAIKTCIQNINGAQIGESAQAGLTYQWTPTAGLSSSTIANPIANPATTTTYTLTATNSGGCTSTDQVIVTVNTTAPTVNAGLDITSCQGSIITLSAVSNAPSLSWTNGIQNNIPFTANIVGTTTYTVTATAANGCTATDAANVTVIATPTANPIPNYIYCSGSQTLPVVFSGTNATSYSWTNSLPSIGLAAFGTGNISSFTAMNMNLVPLAATISVTPINTLNFVACPGAPQTFTMVVNPTPIITSVPNINICNGNLTTPVIFSGTGTSYQWTNSNASIGLPSMGMSNIPSFIGVNTSNASNTATIVVSPQYTNGNLTCVGVPTQFQITVHPTPIALPVQDMVICCQSAINQVNFATSIPGVTVNWAAYSSSPLLTGYPTSGTGSIPSFSPTNLSLNTEYIWFNYTPTSAQGCVGMTDTLTIGVLPCSVFVDTVMDVAQCAGSALNAITFTGNATSFSWVNTNPNNGISFSGVDGIPATTLLNSTQSINTSQILITPNFTDMGLSCVGPIVSFEVAVYPLPVVSAGADQTICDGGTVILSGTGASTYTWTGAVQDGVSFMPNMTGQFAVQGLDSNGCQSTWDSVMVFVNYPSNSNLNISACDTYDLNGQLYTQSGLFTQVIPNSVGCDSTITLDLTLDYSPTTPVITISNGVNLSTSAQTGATYQWIRCSDQTPISGATALTFNPTVNGTYAVVVTNNCGSDTSDCSTVSTIGIDDISFAHIQLYPNPNNGSFKLVIPEPLLGEEISILDMSGRLMKELSADQLEQQIQIDNISTGTYWLVVKAQKPIQFTIQ